MDEEKQAALPDDSKYGWLKGSGQLINPDKRRFFNTTNRKNATMFDIGTNVCLALTQFILILIAYLDAKEYSYWAVYKNHFAVLIACASYRLAVKSFSPFIREDAILWNRFVGRLIFPNVAMIAIWVIFITPTYGNFAITGRQYTMITLAMLL